MWACGHKVMISQERKIEDGECLFLPRAVGAGQFYFSLYFSPQLKALFVEG